MLYLTMTTLGYVRGLFKKYYEFWISPGVRIFNLQYFCDATLIPTFNIYVLDRLRPLLILKNRPKYLYQILCKEQNLVHGRIPNVECGVWWNYLEPKQRDIKCSREVKKMWTTKSVPATRIRQQQTKTLMKWRK